MNFTELIPILIQSYRRRFFWNKIVGIFPVHKQDHHLIHNGCFVDFGIQFTVMCLRQMNHVDLVEMGDSYPSYTDDEQNDMLPHILAV